MFAFGAFEIVAIFLYLVFFPIIFKLVWNKILAQSFGVKEISFWTAVWVTLIFLTVITAILSLFS